MADSTKDYGVYRDCQSIGQGRGGVDRIVFARIRDVAAYLGLLGYDRGECIAFFVDRTDRRSTSFFPDPRGPESRQNY